MKRENMHYVESAIFYVILFFILREWLIPIVELTQTGKLNLLLIFVGICCVLNIFNAPILVSWIVKVGYIAWFLIDVYTDATFLSGEGIAFLSQEMQANVSVILAGDFGQVTNPFRSVLFFLLIWMFIYLIDYWLKVRMTVFYFFVFTVFFIATLDTFTPYDGSAAIAKVVLLGLVMTALLYLKRLMVQTGTDFPLRKYVAYVLPVIIAISVASVVAIMLPKAAPQWPDPVPYIKSLAEGSGPFPGERVSKVGLGNNDSQLGGSFEADNTVVFTVEADSPQYWRVETKDFYTTKGWESSAEGTYPLEVPRDALSLSVAGDPEAEEKVAVVHSQTERNYLLQAYGINGYEYSEEDVGVYLHRATERLSTHHYAGEAEQPLTNYQIMYQSPNYSYTGLKTPPTQSELPLIDSRFLQLPEELPQRVVDLALEVTAAYGLPYDKAREIEQYFRRNSFWYETQNVPVPAEDQDYVDQFLFETKRGYCDNFSTAMVVMLRANNIPARWVKGFAKGDEIDRNEDGTRTYQVENNHAHSWVEAYIDGVGWMTFEPTIGFSAPSQIDYDVDTSLNGAPELLEEQEKDRTVREETETEAQKKATKPNQERSFMWLYVLIGIVALLAIYAFIRRRKWLPKVYIANQRRKEDDKEAVQSAYKVLLKQLDHAGLPKAPDETLSSFAKRVDRYFGTSDMSTVTEVYEKSIYSKNPQDFSYEEIKESWEYLINRTTG